MPDYNIYIRTVGGGNGGRKTTPNNTPKKTKPKNSKKTDYAGLIRKIGNPDSVISSSFSSAAQASPYVAAAMAVIAVADKAIETSISFDVIKSGNYAGYNAYNNFKAGVKTIFTPVSTTIGIARTKTQVQVDNDRKSLQSELLGDAVINSYHGKGV